MFNQLFINETLTYHDKKCQSKQQQLVDKFAPFRTAIVQRWCSPKRPIAAKAGVICSIHLRWDVVPTIQMSRHGDLMRNPIECPIPFGVPKQPFPALPQPA